MKLRCKRCERDWDYQGEVIPKEFPQYVSCPRCKTSVKLKLVDKNEQ